MKSVAATGLGGRGIFA